MISFIGNTWRELSAIDFALQFTPLLQGSHIKWYTENQAAAKIVEVGSMKPDLYRIAISIFQKCLTHCIKLDIQWFPRTENQKADFISRIIDTDDWLATSYNAKVPKYFSRFWSPGTGGVDFFVQNLTNENCLVVPPVSLVCRVLHYQLRRQRDK